MPLVGDYIVVFKQEARGCGNPIDCGTLVVEVEATSMYNALVKAMVKHGWRDCYDHFKGKHKMRSVKIYRIAESNDTQFEIHRENIRQMMERSNATKVLVEKQTELEGLRNLFRD